MDELEVFVSRGELYAMVWAKPMHRLAKEFGISDVALAKTCKKLGVPRPPRGYWARLQAGQHPQTPSLPDKHVSQQDGEYLKRTSVERKPVQLSKSTLDAIALLDLPENKISVSESLIKPHRLVRRTKQIFSGAKADDYGALWGRWDEDCLDLRVSKSSLARALLIMDALLKRLEKLGFEIMNPREGRIRTLVRQNDVELEIKLYERSKRFEQVLTEKQKQQAWRHNKYRFQPTGEFEFTLSRWPLNQRHWKDRHSRPLEDRLNEVVAEIIGSAELVRVEKEKREAERMQRLDEQRLEAEERRRAVEEDQRREELENQALCWRRASDLRLFLRKCEAEFSSLASLESDSKEANWLQWAYQQADVLFVKTESEIWRLPFVFNIPPPFADRLPEIVEFEITAVTEAALKIAPPSPSSSPELLDIVVPVI